MVQHVFSLHTIAKQDNLESPFSIKDYQRYVFGDDELANEYGTALAKAIIARGPALNASRSSNNTTNNSGSTTDVAVAVLSGHVPTATHRLREHFMSQLNDHLTSINSRPARTVDISGMKKDITTHKEASELKSSSKHVQLKELHGITLVVLGDIRMCQEPEDTINASLQELNLDIPVVFAYLAILDGPGTAAILSPKLYSVINPSLDIVESIAQSDSVAMNEAMARYVLGYDHVKFCRFLRGQHDSFVQLLMDYVVGRGFGEDSLYEYNFEFLAWEVDARESI
jgi:hypothetical protein